MRVLKVVSPGRVILMELPFNKILSREKNSWRHVDFLHVRTLNRFDNIVLKIQICKRNKNCAIYGIQRRIEFELKFIKLFKDLSVSGLWFFIPVNVSFV